MTGSLVTVRGLRGRFVVRGVYQDGSITAWGPVCADGRNGMRSKWRAFPAEVVTVVAEPQGVGT